jgi:hypothetical protein
MGEPNKSHIETWTCQFIGKSRQEKTQLTCCGFGASELNLFVDLRSEFDLSQVGIREQVLEVGVIGQSWKWLVG